MQIVTLPTGEVLRGWYFCPTCNRECHDQEVSGDSHRAAVFAGLNALTEPLQDDASLTLETETHRIRRRFERVR